MKEYPKFRSLKVVGAVKIQDVERRADGGILVHLEDGFDTLPLTHQERLHKPHPEKGWYLVRYENGHISFSPAEAFEGNHEPLTDEAPPPAPKVEQADIDHQNAHDRENGNVNDAGQTPYEAVEAESKASKGKGGKKAAAKAAKATE